MSDLMICDIGWKNRKTKKKPKITNREKYVDMPTILVIIQP